MGDRRGHADEVGARASGSQLDRVDHPAAADRHQRGRLGADRVGGQGEGLLEAAVEVGAVVDPVAGRLDPLGDRAGEAAGLPAAAADVDTAEIEGMVAQQRGDVTEAVVADLQQPRQVDVPALGHRTASKRSAAA